MKRRIYPFIVLLGSLILSALVIGCGQSQIYTNDEYDFSCQYPIGWELQDNYGGTLVLFSRPPIFNDDPFININIFVEELLENQGTSLEEYGELSEIQFQELDNYEKLAIHDTTISGIAAKIYVYTFYINPLTVKGAQAFFIKNDIAYIITYTATPDSYDNYYSEFELVMASFNFR